MHRSNWGLSICWAELILRVRRRRCSNSPSRRPIQNSPLPWWSAPPTSRHRSMKMTARVLRWRRRMSSRNTDQEIRDVGWSFECEKAADNMVSGLPGEMLSGMKRPLAPVLAGSIAVTRNFVESEMRFLPAEHRRRCGDDTASSRCSSLCASPSAPAFSHQASPRVSAAVVERLWTTGMIRR